MALRIPLFAQGARTAALGGQTRQSDLSAHLRFRNPLASIVAGTALYMALLRV
jgi:branched-subunit amino acid transport protein AzlD